MSADDPRAEQRVRNIASDALKQTRTYCRSPYETFQEAEDMLASWVADELAKETLDDWTLEYSRDRARARKMLTESRHRMMARRQREKAARFGTEVAS